MQINVTAKDLSNVVLIKSFMPRPINDFNIYILTHKVQPVMTKLTTNTEYGEKSNSSNSRDTGMLSNSNTPVYIWNFLYHP